MVQNRCQNASKSKSGGVLGASKRSKIEVWRSAARLLGASWAILASEVRPGRRLSAVSPPCGAIMGPSWGVYGVLLGRFGGMGTSLASLCWPAARFSALNGSELKLPISDAIEKIEFGLILCQKIICEPSKINI